MATATVEKKEKMDINAIKGKGKEMNTNSIKVKKRRDGH